MVLDVKMEFYNEGNNFDLGLNNQNKDLAFVTMTKIREEVSSNSTKMNNFNKHSQLPSNLTNKLIELNEIVGQSVFDKTVTSSHEPSSYEPNIDITHKKTKSNGWVVRG